MIRQCDICLSIGLSWGEGKQGGEIPPLLVFFVPKNSFGYRVKKMGRYNKLGGESGGTGCISINHLTPNGHYIGRTAQLTSRCCILYIYSTNIRTEYFKHAAQSVFFSLQNAVYFIMLPFLVPVLFTF